MLCLCQIFRLCLRKRVKHCDTLELSNTRKQSAGPPVDQREDVIPVPSLTSALNAVISTPDLIVISGHNAASSPPPHAQPICHISATLTPHMLATLTKIEDLHLHMGNLVYDLFSNNCYGKCVTWPLRKVMVKQQEAKVKIGDDKQVLKDGNREEEEFEHNNDNDRAQLDNAAKSASQSSGCQFSLPNRFRIRVHEPHDFSGAKVSNPVRLKLRIRTGEELGNKSRRELPSLCGITHPLITVEDEEQLMGDAEDWELALQSIPEQDKNEYEEYNDGDSEEYQADTRTELARRMLAEIQAQRYAGKYERRSWLRPSESACGEDSSM